MSQYSTDGPLITLAKNFCIFFFFSVLCITYIIVCTALYVGARSTNELQSVVIQPRDETSDRGPVCVRTSRDTLYLYDGNMKTDVTANPVVYMHFLLGN